MKKVFLLSGLLVVLSFSWLGCNKAGKLNEKSNFKPPSGPIEFKQKWPKGERVEQDIDAKINMDMNIPGQPAPMKQEITMGLAYSMTVLAENPDGTHEVELEFLTARMEAQMGGRVELNYDSTKKAEGGKPDPVGEVFGKVIGAKVQYFLNATNGIDHIEGVDGLLSRLGSGRQAQAAASVKGIFNEGLFKQLMSANTFMPPKPVQPGDSWPVQMNVPATGIGDMNMNYNFTFQNWEKHGLRDCARLEFDGTIKGAMDSSAQTGGASVSIQDGTTSGTSWFDPELGITIDTSMNQDFKMIVRFPQNQRGKQGAAPKMQTMTNTMEEVISVKLVSVK